MAHMTTLLRCLICIVPLAASTRALAQKDTYLAYLKHNQQALVLSSQGEHAAALAEFETAFAVYPWVQSDYFEAVLSALMAGDAERANRFLSEGVRHGFTPEAFYDSTYTAHLQGDAPVPFREQWHQDKLAFAAGADSALIEELDVMVVLDQFVRTSGANEERMAEADYTNFEHLIAICQRNGMPSSRTIGHHYGSMFLLLWHHRGPEYPASAQWKRMLPFIHQAIDAGELSPAFLCAFDDMSDYHAGRPMRYGVLVDYFSPTGHIKLIARDELNRNRASVGLETIEDYAKREGLDLDAILEH